jgi:hypothetical protein
VRYHGVLAPAARWRAGATRDRRAPPDAEHRAAPAADLPLGHAPKARGVGQPGSPAPSLPSPATPDRPLPVSAPLTALAAPGPSIPGTRSTTSPARDRRLSWAELMQRVFARDVLECPACGHRSAERDRGDPPFPRAGDPCAPDRAPRRQPAAAIRRRLLPGRRSRLGPPARRRAAPFQRLTARATDGPTQWPESDRPSGRASPPDAAHAPGVALLHPGDDRQRGRPPPPTPRRGRGSNPPPQRPRLNRKRLAGS